MAKICKSISLKNVEVDLSSMTFTEINKDSSNEYDIMSILKIFDGENNVSISIKKDSDYETNSDEGNDEL